MKRLQSEYTIIRHPKTTGAIVAKLAGEGVILPDRVADYDGFVVQSVPGASQLTDKTVDHSGLSDEKRAPPWSLRRSILSVSLRLSNRYDTSQPMYLAGRMFSTIDNKLRLNES